METSNYQISITLETKECEASDFLLYKRIKFVDGKQLIEEQGIHPKQNKEDLLKYDFKCPVLGYSTKEHGTLCVLKKEVLEVLKNKNLLHFENEDYKLISKNPFDDYSNEHTMLWIKTSDGIVYDVNYQLQPQVIYFHYIGGMMHNGLYHLKKAHEILKQRPDVFELSEVQSIPYYNSDNFHSEYLEFKWLPSTEVYNLFKSKGDSFSSFMALYNEDWLGLRAGGATKFNNTEEIKWG